MSASRILRQLAARELRRTVPEIQRRSFSSGIPLQEQVSFSISGKGHGVAQNITVDGTNHKISTDTYPAFGGTDKFPSPLHFNLTGLSSCTQVTGAIVAKDHGITLGAWDVHVEGKLDPSVLVGGAEDNGNGGNWNSVFLRVKVQADGVEKDKFQQWAKEVERRCPVTQLFQRSGAQWSSSWSQL